MYIHIEITVQALCTRNATRLRQTLSVGTTCPCTTSIGRRRLACSQTNTSILAYVSVSCRMCDDGLASGTFHRGLCVACQIDTRKLDRKYYRRLQILFSGWMSGEGCSVVLPRTLSCLLYTYYNSQHCSMQCTFYTMQHMLRGIFLYLQAADGFGILGSVTRSFPDANT